MERQYEEEKPKLNVIWRENVHSAEDARQFFEKYYPQFPNAVITGLVNSVTDVLSGKTPVEDHPMTQHLTADDGEDHNEEHPSKWKWRDEVARERDEGIINRDMDNLLTVDVDDVDDNDQ